MKALECPLMYWKNFLVYIEINQLMYCRSCTLQDSEQGLNEGNYNMR